MWKKELIKNKIYAVILMCGGALAIPWCDGDATFFLFSLMMGIPLFFAKENWIYEGEEDDGTSREETYSEIRTKSENRHIQSHKILTVRLLGNIYLTRGETIKNVCTKLEGG